MGVLLRANNRYCQMLGYSEEELRTKEDSRYYALRKTSAKR